MKVYIVINDWYDGEQVHSHLIGVCATEDRAKALIELCKSTDEGKIDSRYSIEEKKLLGDLSQSDGYTSGEATAREKGVLWARGYCASKQEQHDSATSQEVRDYWTAYANGVDSVERSLTEPDHRTLIKWYALPDSDREYVHPCCDGDMQIIAQLTGRKTINGPIRELIRDLSRGRVTFEQVKPPLIEIV